MKLSKEQLITRQKYWDNFNSWESEFLATRVETDLANLLNWLDAAWKMAREQNPGWIKQDIDQDKILRIQKTRDAFSKLRGFS